MHNSFSQYNYHLFRIFGPIWLSFLISHLVFHIPNWLIKTKHGESELILSIILGVFILISAGIAIYKPKNLYLFSIPLILFCFLNVYRLPRIPNHIFVSLLINATILISLPLFYTKQRSIEASIAVWFGKLAPYLRLELIIIYFFAVLHKLNADYFNPEISCGKVLYEEIAQIYHLPQSEFFNIASLYGGITLEIAIPLLLLFQRTRLMIIILAIAFHFFLSLDTNFSIVGFTLKMYALLILFLPEEVVNKIVEIGLLKFKTYYHFLFKYSFLLVVLSLFFFIIELIFFKNWHWGRSILQTRILVIFFVELCILVGLLYVFIKYRFDYKTYTSIFNFKPKFSLLTLFILLLLFNGYAPYMGLKTITTLSMFSNLYVEDSTNNHFFMPSACLFFDYPKESIKVVSSDLQVLSNTISKERIIYLEFQRILQNNRSKKFKVSYEYKGRVFNLDFPKDYDSSYWESLPYLVRKFVIFRNLPMEGKPCHCQW